MHHTQVSHLYLYSEALAREAYVWMAEELNEPGSIPTEDK
jgi:hypothetical protein